MLLPLPTPVTLNLDLAPGRTTCSAARRAGRRAITVDVGISLATTANSPKPLARRLVFNDLVIALFGHTGRARRGREPRKPSPASPNLQAGPPVALLLAPFCHDLRRARRPADGVASRGRLLRDGDRAPSGARLRRRHHRPCAIQPRFSAGSLGANNRSLHSPAPSMHRLVRSSALPKVRSPPAL